MSYGRFFAMIATATVVMFGLMYLNTYVWSHVDWSETRAYMALLMGATMAIIMLAFMLSMYSSTAINAAIFVGSAIVFGVALWLVRSQVTVEDEAYMRAMIPHHSIAIMTSSRANISDPRVRKLADEIIYAQDKEIAEMRYLIAKLDEPFEGQGPGESDPFSIGTLEEAMTAAETANVDPEFITERTIAELFPKGAACVFTYTQNSPAVLAVGDPDGVTLALVKISGNLVRLDTQNDSASLSGPRLSLALEGISISLERPDEADLSPQPGERQAADLVMELEEGPTVGYRGYYSCRA